MRPTHQEPEFAFADHDPAPSAVLQAGRAVVVASVVLAPWFFGCIRYTESQYLFAALAFTAILAAAACWYRAVLVPHVPLRLPWLFVPLLLCVLVGAVQLLPARQVLTDGNVSHISEFSAVTAEQPIVSSRFSFYPEATRREILRGVLACLAFLSGYVLFCTRQSRRILWWALALNGLALAGFGMVQQLSWNGKLFWRVPLSEGGLPFASFVNKNNAAAYMLISLAAVAGLVFSRQSRAKRSQQAAVPKRFAGELASLSTGRLLLFVALVVTATGMVASRSRGGFLAMIIAGLGVLLLVSLRERSWGPAVRGLVAVVAVAALAITFEFSDALQQRFSRVAASEVTDDGRIRHWQDVLPILAAVPALGTGMGSYRYATLPFVTETNQPWFVHADNQFVETAVETGVAGLLLLGLFVAIGLFAGWRTIRAGAIASGGVLIFVFISQACHAVFDFGIILPATLVAASVIVGASAASLGQSRASGLNGGRFAVPVLMSVLAGVGAGSVLAWSTLAEEEIVLTQTEDPRSKIQSDAAIERVQQLINRLPGSAELHRRLAVLHVKRYEFAAAEELRALGRLTEEQIEALSRASTLALRVRQLRTKGTETAVRAVLSTGTVRQDIPRARDAFARSLDVCPVLPESHAALFDLAALSEPPDEHTRENFEAALRLEPSNELALARLGTSGFHEPLTRAAAMRCLQRALTTQDNIAIKRVLNGTNPQTYAEFLECMPQGLVSRFRVLAVLPQTSAVRHLPTFLAQCVSEIRSEHATLTAEDLALVIETLLRNDLNEDAVLVSRSVADRYRDRADVRFELARALLKSDRADEALVEARVAAAIEPGNNRFSQFVAQLEKTGGARSNPKSGS